jgi:hypothetical protein
VQGVHWRMSEARISAKAIKARRLVPRSVPHQVVQRRLYIFMALSVWFDVIHRLPAFALRATARRARNSQSEGCRAEVARQRRRTTPEALMRRFLAALLGLLIGYPLFAFAGYWAIGLFSNNHFDGSVEASMTAAFRVRARRRGDRTDRGSYPRQTEVDRGSGKIRPLLKVGRRLADFT